MPITAVRLAEHEHVKALLKLSDLKNKQTAAQIEKVARVSPDPETAIQDVLKNLATRSPVLVQKWRKTIHTLWALHHASLPPLPEIPITEKSASNTYALLDALSVLSALADRPAKLVHRMEGVAIASPDLTRLAGSLESLAEHGSPPSLESLNPQLQRLTACLEAARLIRPHQGRLQVVRSRLRRFLDLPRSYQFYVLWHCDVYHVSWEDFTRRWHRCIRDIQDYLPLLWEVSEATTPDNSIDKRDWCLSVAEAFAPLWESHLRRGLVQAVSSVGFFLHQNSLAATINQLIINDLFARYGFIQFERDGNFVWTPLGINLLAAETRQTLPCGLELLN